MSIESLRSVRDHFSDFVDRVEHQHGPPSATVTVASTG
jgi:hypothetical protein